MSGLLECAECGGPYAIMARDRYGRTNHKKKLGCTNSRTVVPCHIEERVIRAFPESLFALSNLEDISRKLNDEFRNANNSGKKERQSLQKKLFKTDEQIRNIAMAIANGGGVPLASLTSLLATLESDGKSIETQLSDLPTDDRERTRLPVILSPSLFQTSLRA